MREFRATIHPLEKLWESPAPTHLKPYIVTREYAVQLMTSLVGGKLNNEQMEAIANDDEEKSAVKRALVDLTQLTNSDKFPPKVKHRLALIIHVSLSPELRKTFKSQLEVYEAPKPKVPSGQSSQPLNAEQIRKKELAELVLQISLSYYKSRVFEYASEKKRYDECERQLERHFDMFTAAEQRHAANLHEILDGLQALTTR